MSAGALRCRCARSTGWPPSTRSSPSSPGRAHRCGVHRHGLLHQRGGGDRRRHPRPAGRPAGGDHRRREAVAAHGPLPRLLQPGPGGDPGRRGPGEADRRPWWTDWRRCDHRTRPAADRRRPRRLGGAPRRPPGHRPSWRARRARRPMSARPPAACRPARSVFDALAEQVTGEGLDRRRRQAGRLPGPVRRRPPGRGPRDGRLVQARQARRPSSRSWARSRTARPGDGARGRRRSSPGRSGSRPRTPGGSTPRTWTTTAPTAATGRCERAHVDDPGRGASTRSSAAACAAGAAPATRPG